MNISNSKKQLAKIISENGGWPDKAEHSSQDGSDGQVSFYRSGLPLYNKNSKIWNAPGSCVHMYHSKILGAEVIKNFHQTILSRDEYFHLYPAPDADGWIEWKGGERPAGDDAVVDVKFSDGEVGTAEASELYWLHDGDECDIIAYRLHNPEQSSAEQCIAMAFEMAPTIEQLATDYRAKLEVAQQAQEEADSHRCGADAALEKLYRAGLAIGLDIAIADGEPEDGKQPELAITDWRDLRVGDEVEVLYFGDKIIGSVVAIESDASVSERTIKFMRDPGFVRWATSPHFKFIRRP